MRFLVEIADLRVPTPNKYTRVIRALLVEIESLGLAVEISESGDVMSATAPKGEPQSVWRGATLPSRMPLRDDWGRLLKLLAYYFGARFFNRPLSRRLKDDLAWNLAYSFETLSEERREQLVRFLEVDSDAKRRANFHHWLGERGLSIDRPLPPSQLVASRAISVNSEDVIVLAGTSWRLDLSALEIAKKDIRFQYSLLDLRSVAGRLSVSRDIEPARAI